MTRRQKFHSNMYSVNKSASRPFSLPQVPPAWGWGDGQRTEGGEHLHLGLLRSQRCSAQPVYPGCALTGGLHYKTYHCFTTPRENLFWNTLLYYRDFSPNDYTIRTGSVQAICTQHIYTQGFCSTHLYTSARKSIKNPRRPPSYEIKLNLLLLKKPLIPSNT